MAWASAEADPPPEADADAPALAWAVAFSLREAAGGQVYRERWQIISTAPSSACTTGVLEQGSSEGTQQEMSSRM